MTLVKNSILLPLLFIKTRKMNSIKAIIIIFLLKIKKSTLPLVIIITHKTTTIINSKSYLSANKMTPKNSNQASNSVKIT
jgi:hypothetical protein